MQREHSSFRDRSGFVFYNEGQIYRAVRDHYRSQFDALQASGLLDSLIQQDLLIPHNEVFPDNWPLAPGEKEGVYKVLQPELLPFISYPYEWCFQQLKDAALLTLDIQLKALEHDMVLKDASAFNVQFRKGRPVFIDTLSFDHYEEGSPWIAYRQFCCHFLAPLALLSYVTTDLRRLSELFIDGVPLSIASKLLPRKTRFSAFYQLHIHYHAKLEARYSGDANASKTVKRHLSKGKLVAIIRHLIAGISSMKMNETKTEWGDYYKESSYSDAAIEHKQRLVREWTSAIPQIERAWDLGCNTGMFSEIVQEFADEVIAFDIDHLAIDKLYRTTKEKGYQKMLPLLLDLGNPSAAIGWANKERKSFVERGEADMLLALALIHHLCIGNNVPLREVADLFRKLTQYLIIEFIPKQDKQAQRLLVTKEDIFDEYNQSCFEDIFQRVFDIEKKEQITGTERVLYLMKRK